MKQKLFCSACSTPLTGSKKYYRFQTEQNTYTTCVICVAKATQKLKNMKNRTPEENTLLNELEKIGKGKVLHT